MIDLKHFLYNMLSTYMIFYPLCPYSKGNGCFLTKLPQKLLFFDQSLNCNCPWELVFMHVH